MAHFLQLFGEFQLTRENGEPVALSWRGQALLAYLSVVSRPVPRQVLAEMLNPGGDEQEARKALRQTVYLCRKALADGEAIRADECGLTLSKDCLMADVRLFGNAIDRRDNESLNAATELYRGPFLEGFRPPTAAFEDWLIARRAEFLEQVLDAMLSLAASQAAAGRHSLALEHARRALHIDSLREDAHREVMRCLGAMNQRSSALRQYETLRSLLAAELDVVPEPETEALRELIARGKEAGARSDDMAAPERGTGNGAAGRTVFRPIRTRNRGWAAAAFAAALLLVSFSTAFWFLDRQRPPASDLPSVAVLRFDNVSDDPAQDYLERGVVEEITAMLATHPGLRVVARAKSLSYDSAINAGRLGEELGAQYLLEGAVQRFGEAVHITAQLIESETGQHVWARRFEEQGADLATLQQQIASRVYESLVGFTGAIERHEQWQAWAKPPSSLREKDYLLRGEQFYFQFTYEAHTRAREIWREGLAKFPDSAGLRRALAASYRHAAEAGWSEDPEQDLAKAWQMGREASLAPQTSRFDNWLNHWMMAKLAQWCKGDYELSLAEAKAAVELVPYDATSRADLAELLANSGRTGDAIEWLQQAMRLDPKGPDWYKANLAWAYYLAGRHEDAQAELRKLSKPRHLLSAAVSVRLGNLPDARASIVALLQTRADYTITDAARRPLVEPLKHSWLEDLRAAGLPDQVPQ
ncbi:BTAD domain-containing putative transcriptional regulator [Pelagibius marinus]|uniref:BTAD domain-containing putative transcriptional regulator n=1 Tax=Pelagibius marinus TaxID=2762760 RepID=UPI0018723633|nr:BTAD domain-containing putative transcriptional regulator [Pelagibius marinus]